MSLPGLTLPEFPGCLAWVTFIASWLIQLGFWWGPFRKLASLRDEPATASGQELPGLSVIICARNEAENLRKNLPLLLSQSYPTFELWVIDDNSVDESSNVVRALQGEWPQLKLARIHRSDGEAGKKRALARGIECAGFSNLVFTDADCRPASRSWLTNLAHGFSRGSDLVLGYSPFCPQAGWLNAWIRFEGAWTGVQYLSAALCGFPYMGVGRNLAYRKEKVPDWSRSKHYHRLPSGDDDLLVSGIGGRSRTRICLGAGAFMWTEAESDWKSYLRQKRRHFSTSAYYKWYHQVLLLLLPASQIGFYACLIPVALDSPGGGLTALGLWLLRAAWLFGLGGRLLRKLGQPDLVKVIWVLDLVLVIYYLLAFPLLFFPPGEEDW